MTRVAVIFDDRPRPETTGVYCRRALAALADVEHLRPDELGAVPAAAFDLYLGVDDGLRYHLPDRLRPAAWWAIDTHLDPAWALERAARADRTFAAQRPGAAALAAAGVPADWLPLAFDPDVHRPHPVPKRWDACFVGNPVGDERRHLLDRLRARLGDAFFCGNRYFEGMAEAYSAARVAFNRGVRDDVNMRVFEAVGCGALLLTNALPAAAGQDELFRDGVHLATYAGEDELFDKLAFYLRQPEARERVAGRGREEGLARHTYRHRMAAVLRAVAAAPVTAAVPAAPPPGPPPEPAAGRDPTYFAFDRPELLELIPPAARSVLDVGCGAGRLGAAVKRRQAARVTGVELDPAAAAAARSALDEVCEGDVERDVVLPAAAFDAVVFGDVLEHVREPGRLLRRARDWLAPGGVVVASVPNARHHSVVRGLLAGNWTYEAAGLLDRDHVRFFTRREVEKLFHRAGFAVETLRAVPGPGYEEWADAGRPGEVRVGGLTLAGLAPADAEEFFLYQFLAVARLRPEPAWGLTSVVILTHNQLAYTRLCLDSVRLRTDEPYELIVVDNGSTDGSAEYLAAQPDVRLVRNADNRGFPAGCNQGIALARGEQVLLLNNDTVVTTGWLGRLLAGLYAAPDVGLVGPSSNRVSGPQQIDAGYDDAADADGFAWDWGKAAGDAVEETDRLVGFCLLARRAVVDRVGPLDERFGVGCYEDDDYTRRARAAGYRAVIVRGAFVHHFGGRTFAASGVDFADLMARNERLYRDKWADPPPADPSPAAPPAFAAEADADGLRLVPAARPRLSLCMIVRDNAGTIGPCLESARPWVDEMVVVDTGSADDTPRIAAGLGARVSRLPWPDSFAAARNESVGRARGEWVFWMDSDDTLPAACGRGLRDLLAAGPPPAVLGYVMQVHCPGPGPAGAAHVTVVDHVKLFRNRPDLRFEGRIHEQILPAIRAAGGEVGWTDLHVVHSGYDHSPEGQERKRARDLRLLRLELADRPGHPFALFNLGMTYADLRRFGEAADALRGSLAASHPDDSHARKAHALLAYALAGAGRATEAGAALDAALRLYPDDLELRFRRAMWLHDGGRPAEAAEAYRDILARPGRRHFASVDRGMAGFKARQNLAAALADLGDAAAAEAEWRAVTAEAPDYPPGWHGLADALLAAGRPAAVRDLLAGMAARPTLAAAARLVAARLATAEGRTGDAATALAGLARDHPDDADGLRAWARHAFEGGDWAAAADALGRLADLEPGERAHPGNRGAALLQLGRDAEAADALRRAVAVDPDYAAAWRLLAAACDRRGDRRGATAAWREVARLDPTDADAARAAGG